MKSNFLKYVLFLCLFVCIPISYSSGKIDFYKEYLATYYENLISLTDLNTMLPTRDNTLVILASELLDSTTLSSYYAGSFDSIIVICDVDYRYDDDTTCTSTLLYNGTNVISTLESLHITAISKNSTDILLIPEINFISSDREELLSAFFKSITKDDQEVVTVSPVTLVDSFFRSNLYKLFLYCSSLFLLGISFRKLITSDFKEFSLSKLGDYILSIFEKFHEFFSYHQKTSVYFLTLLFLVYIFILSLISLIDIKHLSLEYMLTYVASLFNYATYKNNTLQESLPYLLLLSYTYLFLLFIIFSVYTTVYRCFSLGLKYMLSKNNSYPVTRFTLLGILFVLLFIYIALPIETAAILITFLLLGSTYVLYFKSFFVYKPISTKDIFIVTILLAVTLLSAFGIREVLYSIASARKPINLVVSTDKFISLPYTRSYAANSVFKSHLYTYKYPIFANQYLVFHPDFKYIVNRNSLLFDASTYKNFIFTAQNTSDFIRDLLGNPYLQKLFTVEKTSNYWNTLLIDPLLIPVDGLYLKIKIDCSTTLVGQRDIYLNVYSMKEKLSTDDSILFNFPGCATNKDVATYMISLPILKDSTTTSLILLNISNFNYLDSLKIELYGNSNIPLEFTPMFMDLTSSVLLSNISDTDSYIYNFSSDIPGDVVLENTTDKSLSYDLSVPLNYLLFNKLLANPLVLWSNSINAFINGD